MEIESTFQWGQKRNRSGGSTAQPTVAQVRAAEIPREGGRFVKPKVSKGSATSCPASKPLDARLREERDAVRKQLADVIQEHKESRAAETAQWTRTMHVLNGNIAAKETKLRSMRKTNQILKRKIEESAVQPVAQPKPKLARKLIGGTSAGVKTKLATEVEDFPCPQIRHKRSPPTSPL